MHRLLFPIYGLIYLLLVTSGISVQAATFDGVPILTEKRSGESFEYVQGQILVGLKPGTTESEFRGQLGRGGREIVQGVLSHSLFLVTISEPNTLFSEIEAIRNLPTVRYAEPNKIHHLLLTPNDSMFIDQWDLNNTGQSPPSGRADSDVDGPEGWTFGPGKALIKVGVLDTGIPIKDGILSHPDLDDTSRFSLGGNYVGGTLPVDSYGHGTHVIGTIGAESNNRIGVAGTAWQCQIRAIKVFDEGGNCSDLSFYKGVLDAVDHGCKVICYSGGASYSSTLEAAVAYADIHDVVICAAAGNSYHGSVSYPAALSKTYGNVICVSATDHNDASSGYSSIGPEVTVAAPGGYGPPFDENDILSTFPNYPVWLSIVFHLPLNYCYLAGTSMACPHVAGLAALVYSTDPLLGADSVRQLIVNGSDDLGPPGFDNYFGYGRINVYNTLLKMRDINIGHQPLPDTKATTQPYRVDCTIYSAIPLVSDSSLLHFRIGTGNWVTEFLTSSIGTGSYYGSIPVQVPGTTVSYYISARNSQGIHKETPVYSFRVIDYKVNLCSTKPKQSVISQGIASYDLSIINEGIYTDQYSLIVSGSEWNTAIRDASTGDVITMTPVLVPNDSFALKVVVAVPQSICGVRDSVLIQSVSMANPSILASTSCITTSLGQPISLPFGDEFTSTQVDIARWVYNNAVEIDDKGLSEPSAPFALHLDGCPNGADTIISQIVLLQEEYSTNLNYSFERTGSGESPADGSDLCVDFLDADSNWVLLRTQSGADPDMQVFQKVSIPLPTTALHSGFRLRFRSSGDLGHCDDWFVDNVCIAYSPQISFSVPASLDVTLSPPDSADRSILIGNTGASDLVYRIEILPQPVIPKAPKNLHSAGIENQDGLDGPDIVSSGSFLYTFLSNDLAAPTANWLAATPNSGTIATGGSDVINLRYLSAGLAAGDYGATISVFSGNVDPTDSLTSFTATLTVPIAFTCGDADGDKEADVADIVYLICYIFAGGRAPAPLASGDVNCDDMVNISDAAYLIAHIFSGGLGPCAECK